MVEDKKDINKCYIDVTGNNLFVRIMDMFDNILIQASTGQVQMKGPRKRTSYAAELVGRKVGEKALLINKKVIDVYIRGRVSKSVRSAIIGLEAEGIVISSITLLNIVAHNGVRLPRGKRK